MAIKVPLSSVGRGDKSSLKPEKISREGGDGPAAPGLPVSGKFRKNRWTPPGEPGHLGAMDFPTTQWTQMAEASLHGDGSAQAALEAFCLRYREPVVRLLRNKGLIESRVEDLAHDFFLQLMQRSSWKRADRQQGRFRQFLCGALSRFLLDDARRNQSLKRGGGESPLSMDAAGEVAAPHDEADFYAEFDRNWALGLLEASLQRLEQQYAAAGKADRYAVLKNFLPGSAAAMSGEEAAAAMGMNHNAARSEISRMRAAFRAALREEVAGTVASPEDIQDELRFFQETLSKT